MALDVSGISAPVFDKLNKVDGGKFSTASMLVAMAKKPTQTVANTIVDLTVPLNKKKFPNPDTFWNTVTTKLNSELYKILKHNSSISYVVLPNFQLHRDFRVIKTVDSISGDSLFLNASQHILAANGPFGKYYYLSADYFIAGPTYINGSLEPDTIPAFLSGSLQYEHPAVANFEVGKLKIRKSDSDGISSVSGASVDGMSSLPPLIINSIYQDSNGKGYDQNFIPTSAHEEARKDNKLGGQIFAYNSVRDIAMVIIREDHGTGTGVWDMDIIRESLISFGFENAVFLDGSDSVFLREFIGPGKSRLIVSSIASNYSKNTGLDYFYAVKY